MNLRQIAELLQKISPTARMTIRIRDGEAVVSVRDEHPGFWPTLLAKTYSNSIELAVEHALEIASFRAEEFDA